MKKGVQIALIVVLFLLLIAIRAFSQNYFYDPFIAYFKQDYLHTAIPKVNFNSFFSNLFLRFLLNTSISLAIIYVAFYNLKIVIFAIKFYVIAFIVLGAGLFLLLKFSVVDGYLLIFYIRRFLIHPLFLLILLPAFYYQKLQLKK